MTPVRWPVPLLILLLSGCGLESPAGRVVWLVLLPLVLIAWLLWSLVRRSPRDFYDRDERRRPDHDSYKR